MQFLAKIQEITGFPQIMFLSDPRMFTEVLSLLLTPNNKFNPRYRLIYDLFTMGCVPSLTFKLEMTVGVTRAFWHNVETRSMV